MDAFWKKVDQHVTGHGGGWDLAQVLPEDRQLYRTPAFVEIAEEPRIESEAIDQESLHDSIRHMQLNVERGTDGTSSGGSILPAKTKIRTRGIARPESPNIEPEDTTLDSEPKIQVGKRASKVFSLLFPSPSSSQSTQPGEIPWLDFLHAMCSTGFITEKLYGSVWQFTPTNLDVERSIQFHEPIRRKNSRLGSRGALAVGSTASTDGQGRLLYLLEYFREETNLIELIYINDQLCM